MDDTPIKATHQARHENWICTKCAWRGSYSSTAGVMYHDVDWQHCPSCNAIALPITGSTMSVKQYEETIPPQYICMTCKTVIGPIWDDDENQCQCGVYEFEVWRVAPV